MNFDPVFSLCVFWKSQVNRSLLQNSYSPKIIAPPPLFDKRFQPFLVKFSGLDAKDVLTLRYAEYARRISRMLAAKPFKPREQLVKYVEFAAEFGTLTLIRCAMLALLDRALHEKLKFSKIISHFIKLQIAQK